MAISPINGMGGVLPTGASGRIAPTPPAARGGESSFSKLVGDLVKDANAQHTQADQSLQQLMTGESDDLHQVVMDAAKADMSFRLLVEIRNRLLDAYQEIMRMQV